MQSSVLWVGTCLPPLPVPDAAPLPFCTAASLDGTGFAVHDGPLPVDEKGHSIRTKSEGGTQHGLRPGTSIGCMGYSHRQHITSPVHRRACGVAVVRVPRGKTLHQQHHLSNRPLVTGPAHAIGGYDGAQRPRLSFLADRFMTSAPGCRVSTAQRSGPSRPWRAWGCRPTTVALSAKSDSVCPRRQILPSEVLMDGPRMWTDWGDPTLSSRATHALARAHPLPQPRPTTGLHAPYICLDSLDSTRLDSRRRGAPVCATQGSQTPAGQVEGPRRRAPSPLDGRPCPCLVARGHRRDATSSHFIAALGHQHFRTEPPRTGAQGMPHVACARSDMVPGFAARACCVTMANKLSFAATASQTYEKD
ncbi:hypothetical protein CDD83_8424 [Cordyceps sp. RAO-2017]|nr:hypothetical protein CDD83_8424 [Cordyceps sp. RAO-2017]